MEISEVAWTDGDRVRRFAAVRESVRASDQPWGHPVLASRTAAMLRHGWDGEPALGLLASVDGVDVAAAEYEVTTYDNRHLAWLTVEVHPAHRRRGHGTSIVEALLDRARAEGRTSAGGTSWDSGPARAFAAAHGFEVRLVEVNRRQVLAAVDPGVLEQLHADALGHAGDYLLERRSGATPAADLAALAELTAAINDAPTGDLDMEDEAFPPERVAAYERAWLDRGDRLLRVVARHRASGEPAGQTVVVVEGERPEIAEQHDTSVARAHRGHRLGLLLKTEMVRWLAEAEPQVATIDTWNAESNGHMVGVNELLGYQVLGRALHWQRRI